MGVSSTGEAAGPRASVRPPAVRPGDRVAVLALSGPLAARCPRRLRRAVAELRRRGLDAVAGEGCSLDTGDRAGSAEVRAAAFTAAVTDPGVRAVLSAIGGDGTREILPLLDPGALAASPTAVIGYSDTSSLLLWLRLRLGWTTYYGPAAMPQFGEAGGVDDHTWDTLWDAVGPRACEDRDLPSLEHVVVEQLWWDRDDDRPRAAVPAPARETWRPGTARGPLLAANLSTLAGDLRQDALPTEPWRGQTVFLEESDAATWDEFRDAVATVAESGLLDGCAALVFGRFAQVVRDEWPAADVREALAPLTAACAGPVVGDAEFGHTDPHFTLPLGTVAEVSASRPGTRVPRLRLLPERRTP